MDKPPFTTSYQDRHGRTRWRFRYRGRQHELPGQPGEPAFEAAYAAAVEQRPARKATVARLPLVQPRSLRAAWLGLQRAAEWKRLGPTSVRDQTRIAERFLTRPIAAGAMPWGDAPVADLRRKHVKRLLDDLAGTPHAADHVLRLLRKLVGYALDEEWIDVDPTYRLRWRPPTDGHRAWTPDELAVFAQCWPPGTTPRLVFMLALFTGARRVDLVKLRWDDVRDGVVTFRQVKTGVPVALDVLAPLADELARTSRRGPTILVTQYGRPFSDKSLTGRFRDWCEMAGLAGTTLHGLRKTLGAAMADGGATAKGIQAALGHTTLQQADLYTKAADRQAAARAALKVVRFKGV